MDTITWFAIPGKNFELTQAELNAQLSFFARGEWSITRVAREALKIKQYPMGDGLHNLPQFERDLAVFSDRLGSITRSGIVVGTCSERQLLHNVLDLLKDQPVSRFEVGISAIGSWSDRQVEQFALQVKRELKKTNRPVRVHIPRQETMLSPVVVQKQLLDKHGFEFVLMQEGNSWTIGKTAWVHRFEEWGDREFGKASDARRGMLPQKLARIMVNLSGIAPAHHAVIMDPFCGVGTILQEASQIGFDVYGSDLDEKAIVLTKRNLESEIKEGKATALAADARFVEIPAALRQGNGAICTEPFLGRVWTYEPSERDAMAVVDELAELYASSLKHWRAGLAVGVPVVMVFPVVAGKATFDKIVDSLPRFGYSRHVGPIRYARAGQFVQRDIVKLVTV